MFDPSAPHIIILLIVVLILFGSTRLPGAAEALGKSMRIFRSEAKKMHNDDEPVQATPVSSVQQPVAPPTLPPQSAAPDATQQQLQDMQRQLQELQRQAAANGGSAAGSGDPRPDTQRDQQPR
jgi:sec-independent protein translocase protein TatA